MARYKPVVDNAVQLLSSMIADGRLKRGDTLPSVRELSQSLRISTVSLSKAIGVLKKQGTIAGGARQRSVVIAGPAAGEAVAPEQRRISPAVPLPAATDRIVAELHREILLGEYGPDRPLPPVKELKQRFRASQRTIRAVLRLLHEKGLVEPCQRWFRVRHYGERRPNARIAFVGFTYGPHNEIIRGMHDTYMYSLFQTESWRRNLVLDQVGCPRESSDILYAAERRPYAFQDNVIGAALLLSHRCDAWPGIFAKLAGLRIPVAIIDEFGHWNVRESFPAPGKVRVFSFASGALAAREVTRVLLGHGHRRFAYISPYRHMQWSIVRREAIREELRQAGLESSLELLEFNVDDVRESYGLDDSTNTTVHQYLLTDGLARFPKVVQRAYTRGNDVNVWSMNITREAVDQQLRYRLPRLARQRDITAWITVNDESAIVAQQVLRKNGVAVPGDVSLVSFDNLADAQDLRISTYDFNAPGLVAAVLNFLVSSTDPWASFCAERIEIPGTVIPRASLGPAPKR